LHLMLPDNKPSLVGTFSILNLQYRSAKNEPKLLIFT